VRRSRLVVAALLAAGTGCIDLTSNPSEIVAIEFPDLPSPAVVAGDTLRDSTGKAAVLNARLFNAEGVEVAGQPVQFFTADTTISIVTGNYLVGRVSADGVGRLVAAGAGLQSIVRQVEVVRRPDSLAANGTFDTLRLRFPDTPEANVSSAIGARVLARDPALGATGVRAWIVTFSLEHAGAQVPASDTSLVFLVNELGKPSRVDTSDTQGSVARRVRFKAGAGLPPVDSVTVIIEARYRGTLLAGSPLRRVLPVKPG
jgi:hypothetical protein